MLSVLMSIHPKYVELIKTGQKRYEYRRVGCRKLIDRIVIYATQPYSYIVGEAKVSRILMGSKEDIWEKTYRYAGISEKEYLNYFKGKETALAYEITDFQIYHQHKSLHDAGLNRAPQSFYYLEPEQYEKLQSV